jgi:hypothetical protein
MGKMLGAADKCNTHFPVRRIFQRRRFPIPAQ